MTTTKTTTTTTFNGLWHNWTQSSFELFWPIQIYLDLLEPIWTYLDLFKPTRTYLDLYGPSYFHFCCYFQVMKRKMPLNFVKEPKFKFYNNKWNYFNYFQASDQKTSYVFFYFYEGAQNWFSKQEIELSKQELESFYLLPGLW